MLTLAMHILYNIIMIVTSRVHASAATVANAVEALPKADIRNALRSVLFKRSQIVNIRVCRTNASQQDIASSCVPMK